MYSHEFGPYAADEVHGEIQPVYVASLKYAVSVSLYPPAGMVLPEILAVNDKAPPDKSID